MTERSQGTQQDGHRKSAPRSAQSRKPPPPLRPRGLRALLSLTQAEMRVLGFLFGMGGATFEIISKEIERLGYLGFYAALMGLSSLWKPGKPE